MLGKILVYIALALATGSAVSYFTAFKKDKFLKAGEYLYFAVNAVLVFISVYLWANIFAHNFQYTYIWEYSSKELPVHLLFTSFFSGQEGSFLLWALFLALFGLAVQPYAKKYNYQAPVMGFYSLILVFIVLMLVAKSPFNYIWDSFPDSGIASGFLPENGRGLNPILENFWNIIHPPILFLGYAAMTVPFVFALAALIKKDYNNWIQIALPWTLFASAMLGTGIMLGGFWAYETLGWGGFWGWDPVENSSLIPWLVSVSLVHTMLVQKKTGGLIKTNFLLALMSFLFVIYATFLTRSGVLADSSVHSFGEPGKFVYILLMVFQIVFALIGLFVLALRLKHINQTAVKLDFKVSSREFMLSMGTLALLASAAIILIGTSLPIFQELTGQTKAAIESSFYDKWNLPIAIIMLIFNSLSLFVNWKETNSNELIKRILVSFITTIVLTVVIFFMGVNEIGYLALVAATLFTIFSNIEYCLKVVIKKPSKTGSYISHIGIAALLLGAMASGAFSETHHVTLKTGETKQVLGYKLTFTGKQQIQKELKDREKYEFIIKAEKGGSTSILKPIFYWSDFNKRQAPFLEPGISTNLTEDIYISPKAVSQDIDAPNFTIAKGEKTKTPIDSNIFLTVKSFDMSQASNMGEDGSVILGAIVEFDNAGRIYEDTLYSSLDMNSMQGKPMFVQLENSKYQIGFTQLVMGSEQGTTLASFIFSESDNADTQYAESFTFDISRKPFMNLVWFGATASVIGFFIAMFKYLRKKKYMPTQQYSE